MHTGQNLAEGALVLVLDITRRERGREGGRKEGREGGMGHTSCTLAKISRKEL